MNLISDNRYLFKKTLHLIVITLFMLSFGLFAQGTFSVNQTGDWDQSTTWTLDSGSDGDLVPDSDDIVNIDAAFTVTLTQSEACSILTISNGSAVLDLSANTLTVGTNVVISAGDLDDATGGSTLEVGGNFTISSGGTFNTSANGMSIDFNGTSGTQTVSGTYSGTLMMTTLTKSAGSTLDWNLSGSVELDGQLLLEDGVFEAGSATYTLNYGVVNGYCFNKSGGTFTAQTSTINIVSGANTRMSIDDNTSFYRIRHNPGVGRSLSLDETNAGIATYTISNQFDRSNASSEVNLLSEAAISYGSSATLRYSLSVSAEDVSSEWPRNGGPRNVTFASSVNITTALNRVIPSGGTLTLSQSGGNFIVADSSLTVNGILSRQTAGTTGISTSGTGSVAYAAIGSLLRYNTGAATTIGAEWPAATGNPPENVEINVSSGALSATNISRTVRQDLTLSVGTINLGNGILTVLGTVTGSVISGGATIADATTLRVGNSGTGTSYNQQITGNLILNKLIVYKTGGSTVNNNTVVLATAGDLNFTAGGTLTITAGVLDLNAVGQFTTDPATLTIQNGGTLRTGGTSLTGITTLTVNGTLVLDGTSQETLPTGITMDSLEIDNSAGVITSNGTLTIGGNLAMTNGIITTTSSNILRFDSDATATGTFSATRMIIGPLQKELTTTTAFTYPIGSGSTYRPVTFQYTDLPDAGTSVIEIEHSTASFTPKSPPGGINEIDAQMHYIVIDQGTGSGTIAYNFTGTYRDGNFIPETRNRVLVETSTSYTAYGGEGDVDEDNNTVAATGISALPASNNFIVFGAGGTTLTWDDEGSDNDWFNGLNWSSDVIPTASDNVLITGVYTVNIAGNPTAALAKTLTIGDGSNLTVVTVDAQDTLRLHSNSGSSLTVRQSSRLVIDDSLAVVWNSSKDYEPDSTNYLAGSTVEYTASPVEFDVYGNLTVNNSDSTTRTRGTGTIIVGNALTKSGTQVFAPNNAITVSGAFNQSGGNTDGGSVALTLNGNVNISAGTFIPSTITTFTGSGFQISGSGEVSSSTGAMTFSGASAQTIADNSSASLVFNDLTVNKSVNNVSLNSAASIDGALTLTSGDIITTPSNLLTLTTNASVTAGSDNSHINGPLARNTDATSEYVFPLGNGTTWRRIGVIPASTTAETYTARFFNSNPQAAYSNNLNTPDLQKVSSVSYWTIGRSGSVNAQVRLYWETSIDGVDHDNLASLRVARYEDDGPYWTDEGNSGTTTSGSFSGTITSDAGDVTDFESQGAFALGSAIAGDHSLPVSLTSFEAKADFRTVSLSWKTESEINNDGFYLYRRDKQQGEKSDWILLNDIVIAGKGNTSEGSNYNFMDESVASGMIYEYMLESINVNGEHFEEQTIEVTVPVPTEYVLFNNYPNPFNPATSLKFQLPQNCAVTISVYNINGQLIKTLLNNVNYTPGEYVVKWNGDNQIGHKVASGIYIYRFTADTYSKIGRMVLLK
jgi:hypothetical protein